MLSQPVTASTGGVVSSQWAAGWGAPPLPPSTTDLMFFAAVILFMVFTVALAAIFVRDDPPRREGQADRKDNEPAGRRARPARRPATLTSSGVFAAMSCASRRRGA